MLYPKQTPARMVFDLDGVWDFQLGTADGGPDPAKPLPSPTSIAVPASYNDQNPEKSWRDHYGWAYYQRTITLPRTCAGQRIVLRFGSVTHAAKFGSTA